MFRTEIVVMCWNYDFNFNQDTVMYLHIIESLNQITVRGGEKKDQKCSWQVMAVAKSGRW